MTPGVGHLRERTAAVRAGFAAHRAIGWTVLALLTVPVAFVAVVLLSLLVLPGPPVFRVLAEGRVSPLAQTLEFGVLLAGLYAVTRTAHSAESRRLARQVAEAIVRYIDEEVRPAPGETAPSWTARTTGCSRRASSRRGSTGSRARPSSAGCRSTPSPRTYSLVADPETLAALRGHLDLEPAG